MDWSVSLFNPNPSVEYTMEDFTLDNRKNRDFLPPEPPLGNVEYKLKIVNPTSQRFEHLVTQLKWRLGEGGGAAIYQIGVEDCGVLAGLTQWDMMESLQTLQRMALKLGATMTVLKERVLDNGGRIAQVLVRKADS